MARNHSLVDGGKVALKRAERRLTQERLAEKADLSVRKVQQLESGGDHPTASLVRVAKALGCDVSELVFRCCGPEDVRPEGAEAGSTRFVVPRYDDFIKRGATAQLERDLRRSALDSSTSVASALFNIALPLRTAGVVKDFKLRETSLIEEIDYHNKIHVGSHIKSLSEISSVIKVSCPSLFPAARSAFISFAHLLARYGCLLDLDTADVTTKAQIHSLSRAYVDFAVMADPPFMMCPGDCPTRRAFVLVLPCFWHEDCLLSVDGDNTLVKPPLIYYHEASTAELMLRNSIFWARRNARRPVGDAFELPSILNNLASGEYATAWEPLTSAMYGYNPRLRVVPGTRFRSYVSLYAHRDWFHRSRRPALLSFVDLFIAEWKSLGQRQIP